MNVRLKPVETCCWAAHRRPKRTAFVLSLVYSQLCPSGSWSKIWKLGFLCCSVSPYASAMNTRTHNVPVRVWQVFEKAWGSICHLQHLLKTGSDNTGLLLITITPFTGDALRQRSRWDQKHEEGINNNPERHNCSLPSLTNQRERSEQECENVTPPCQF